MENKRNAGRVYRFGPFELDPRAGELRKHGIRIGLQEQPLQILTMMLAQPGEAVLRERIQQKLWPNNTMVEFDHGINAAIKRLRVALGDSADTPRYVETLARRGYRFIAAVEGIEEEPPPVAVTLASPEWDPADLTGKSVNHYRVLERLGSGGMGVVYRAEDTKLGRQVALKFLPCSAAETPPRILDRFRREAQVAAALNHPHICAVYGVEEVSGEPMIVMELVEGQSLAERLAKGPLPFDQTLQLGVQLAQALDAGHRAGIVHRDFKPANIMLTRSGAKILDFGLAKWERAAEPEGATEAGATQPGTVLGTLNYLSPEQAQGRDVDARSDIFAFGVVLYEMATGKKAFHGPNRVSVIAAILERQPPSVSAAMPGTPIAFERLVTTCLAKDPDDRQQSLHDVSLQLGWIADAGPIPASGARRNRLLLWGASALAMLAVAGTIVFFALRGSGRASSQLGVVHVLLPPPEGAAFAGGMAVSPDGSKLAAVIFDASNVRKLWVRSLRSLGEQILPDTVDASQPFWSADSKSIGFFAREKLRTIAASEGPVQSISDALRPNGGTWNADGTILYCPDYVSALHRVPAQGGVHQLALRQEEGEIWGDTWPHFLPDGLHFLFHASYRDDAKSGVFLGALDSLERRLLMRGVSEAHFAPPDYLLFLRAGAVMAQNVDIGRARPIGEPTPVTGGGNAGTAGATTFSASENGVLVYGTLTPAWTHRLTWRGRDGQQLGSAGEPGAYAEVFLSPDETMASVILAQDGPSNLWLLHFDTNVLSRLTFEPTRIYDGVWSPDSRRLLYQIYSPQRTKLMILTLGEHSPKVLLDDGNPNFPDDWSPDGKWILGRRTDQKLFILAADGSSQPKVLLDAPYRMDQFQFSPDGQWVAYNSVESGQWEVYVARFPAMTGTRQLSRAGGCQPIWRRDGKELFYLTQDGKMMSVPLMQGSTLQAAAPKMLFQSNIPVNCSITQYAAGSNGQKFLMVEPDRQKDPLEAREPLHVLINWQAGLRR